MASLVLCTAAAALLELLGSVWSCSSFCTGSLCESIRSLSSVLLWLLTPGFCYFLVPSLQHDIHVPCDRAVLPGEAWKAAGQGLETSVSCRYQGILRERATVWDPASLTCWCPLLWAACSEFCSPSRSCGCHKDVGMSQNLHSICGCTDFCLVSAGVLLQ